MNTSSDFRENTFKTDLDIDSLQVERHNKSLQHSCFGTIFSINQEEATSWQEEKVELVKWNL